MNASLFFAAAQDLDDAVLRRFSRRVFCDLPDSAGRRDILTLLTAGEALAADVDLAQVRLLLDYISG